MIIQLMTTINIFIHHIYQALYEMKRCKVLNLLDRMTKQHIILVHGACHGAWCWYKVATLLESAGHRVTVPDLAASGIDGRRIEEVETFGDYMQPLMEIMASIPEHEKVILVGHSFGGSSIAMAAERFPEKVAALVFATAFMPDLMHSPSYVLEKYSVEIERSSVGFMDSQLISIVGSNGKTISTFLFRPQAISLMLYQHCLPEDIMLATMLLRPISVYTEDLKTIPPLSKEKYGSVPCFYIQCREDALITNDFQHWMTENHPVKRVFEIEGADHMPMLSKPLELNQCLLQVANEVVDGAFISE